MLFGIDSKLIKLKKKTLSDSKAKLHPKFCCMFGEGTMESFTINY